MIRSAAVLLLLAVAFAAGVTVSLRAAPPVDGCVALPDDILRQIETGRAPGQ